MQFTRKRRHIYLLERSWHYYYVVQRVSWYPYHRWKTQAYSHHFRPCWILVTAAIFEWLILHDLKYEDELEDKKKCNWENFCYVAYNILYTLHIRNFSFPFFFSLWNVTIRAREPVFGCCNWCKHIIILTTMITGANRTQHMYQNLFKRIPIIWCTQSQNFFAPKIHDIAIVWKKHTHNMDIPLAE